MWVWPEGRRRGASARPTVILGLVPRIHCATGALSIHKATQPRCELDPRHKAEDDSSGRRGVNALKRAWMATLAAMTLRAGEMSREQRVQCPSKTISGTLSSKRGTDGLQWGISANAHGCLE